MKAKDLVASWVFATIDVLTYAGISIKGIRHKAALLTAGNKSITFGSTSYHKGKCTDCGADGVVMQSLINRGIYFLICPGCMRVKWATNLPLCKCGNLVPAGRKKKCFSCCPPPKTNVKRFDGRILSHGLIPAQLVWTVKGKIYEFKHLTTAEVQKALDSETNGAAGEAFNMCKRLAKERSGK